MSSYGAPCEGCVRTLMRPVPGFRPRPEVKAVPGREEWVLEVFGLGTLLRPSRKNIRGSRGLIPPFFFSGIKGLQ